MDIRRGGRYCYVDDDDYSVYEYDEEGGKEEDNDNRASVFSRQMVCRMII